MLPACHFLKCISPLITKRIFALKTTPHTHLRQLFSGTSRQPLFPARFSRGISPSARVQGVLRLRRLRGADRRHGPAAVEGESGVGGTPGVDWDASGGLYVHTRGQMVWHL